MTTDTEKLHAAAARLDELIAAVDADQERASQDWHTEPCSEESDEDGEHLCIVGTGTIDHGIGISTSRAYIADCETPAIAAYATAMDPLTGKLLAKLLRDCAMLHDPTVCTKHEGCQHKPLGCSWCGDEDFPCQDVRNALALANRILNVRVLNSHIKETV